MKVKHRIAHIAAHSEANKENEESRKAICNRVKVKLNGVGHRSTRTALVPVTKSISAKKTPVLKPLKKNHQFHVEATYAAPPIVKSSAIIQGEIDKGAEEFRKIIATATQKKKLRIHSVNW